MDEAFGLKKIPKDGSSRDKNLLSLILGRRQWRDTAESKSVEGRTPGNHTPRMHDTAESNSFEGMTPRSQTL